MERVGVLGLGRMGRGIADRLVRAGVSVTAFDIVEARRQAFHDERGVMASCAEDVAAEVDVLVTVLPGPAELRQVLLGDRTLDRMRPGSCWLDLTSNDPRVAGEVARAAAERGIDVVGAPMAGDPTDAAAGTLGFYVGGSPDAVRRVAPLLELLGDPHRIVPMGHDVAAGYTTKLLANTLWFGQTIAVTEVMLLGQELGLDLLALRGALESGPGSSSFIIHHLDSLLAGDYLTTFGVSRVVDELDTVTALADEAQTPFDLTALVASLHHEALQRFGPVDGELLAAKLLEIRASRTLRA